MFSFRQYVNSMIKNTIIYFLVVFIILNFGLFSINTAYKQELTLQKENEFVRILEHLYYENGLDFIVEYTEHYGHIHNTFNIVQFDGETVFSSSVEGNYREYMITDRLTVYINSSESTNSVLTNLLFYVSNISLVIVFILGIYIFYYFSKKKTMVILNDIQELKTSIDSLDEDRSFSFLEFDETYQELKRVNKELNNASLLKLNKLKGVNHDLNTSLTVIKSYLEGYKSGRMTLTKDEIDELLEEVEFNARLVKSLLGNENATHSLDLSVLTEKILKRYRTIYDTKNIELITNIQKDVYVKGNHDDIKRIIQNILSNSYYYSNSSTSVKVTLSTEAGIVLSIEDEGVGLNENEMSLVFEKEYRSEEAVKRNKSGKGIGLYISREMMREYNGDIEIIRKQVGLTVNIKFSS